VFWFNVMSLCEAGSLCIHVMLAGVPNCANRLFGFMGQPGVRYRFGPNPMAGCGVCSSGCIAVCIGAGVAGVVCTMGGAGA
jgi:hypothetical protein